MKKIIPALLLFATFSCKEKEPSKSDFMQRAINGDSYKNISGNLKRVNDSLDLRKTRKTDTNVIIYIFNTTVGSSTLQAKTMGQVIDEMNKMNKDSIYLKTARKQIAEKLEKEHLDSLKKSR